MALLTVGCAHPVRGPAVPEGATTRAQIPWIPDARFWPDGPIEPMLALARASMERERADLAQSGQEPTALPPVHLLAISGGGEEGAFGAGLLVGWGQRGTRPEFKLVTGVSTGALIAPLVFLGGDYDDALAAMYTDIDADDIFEERGIFAALFDDAMSDTRPLRRTVAGYADADLLSRVAEEYQRGRLLLIATTDLDARRPVVWNMGAIAASGAPGALDLFRDILVASAAVPALFPPVMIDVEVDGRRHQEMHVDGGTITQVFVYPPSLVFPEAEQDVLARDRVLYVVRNARLDADWASTDRLTTEIAGRAISSLIQSQGVGDLYRIYLTTERDGIDFNLAFIGEDFDLPLEEPFDPDYLQALYAYGHAAGLAGYAWHDSPPDFHEVADR